MHSYLHLSAGGWHQLAALTVPEVAEAAAVPVIDDIRSRMVEMYISQSFGNE